MTLSRRNVYKRSWYRRECKVNIKARKREYNRKIRHAKLNEDSCCRDYIKRFRCLDWNTIS